MQAIAPWADVNEAYLIAVVQGDRLRNVQVFFVLFLLESELIGLVFEILDIKSARPDVIIDGLFAFLTEDFFLLFLFFRFVERMQNVFEFLLFRTEIMQRSHTDTDGQLVGVFVPTERALPLNTPAFNDMVQHHIADVIGHIHIVALLRVGKSRFQRLYQRGRIQAAVAICADIFDMILITGRFIVEQVNGKQRTGVVRASDFSQKSPLFRGTIQIRNVLLTQARGTRNTQQMNAHKRIFDGCLVGKRQMRIFDTGIQQPPGFGNDIQLIHIQPAAVGHGAVQHTGVKNNF